MKCVISLLAIIAFPLVASAQHFSAGVATGASFWSTRPYNTGAVVPLSNTNRTSWNKELYVRYQTKKRFGFEAGVGHDNYSEIRHYTFKNPDGRPGTAEETRSNHIGSISLRADYSLLPQCLKKCAVLSKFSSHAGLNINVIWFGGNTEMEFFDATSGEFEYRTRYRQHATNFWAGFQHTLQYQLNSRLQLRNTVSFQVMPEAFWRDSFLPTYSTQSNTRFLIQMGLGYRL